MCKKCLFYGQLNSATCKTLTHQQVGVMCPEVTHKNTSSEFEAKHDFDGINSVSFYYFSIKRANNFTKVS